MVEAHVSVVSFWLQTKPRETIREDLKGDFYII